MTAVPDPRAKRPTGDHDTHLRYKKPAEPPPPFALRNLDDWEKLVDTSLDRVTEMAQRWQAGLAGFIGIITAILLLEGGKTSELAHGWALYTVMVLLLAAVLLAVVGLWKALAASAPPHAMATYDQIIASHGTIRAYKLDAAKTALRRLSQAKILMAIAFVLLGAAIVVWWTVPTSA